MKYNKKRKTYIKKVADFFHFQEITIIRTSIPIAHTTNKLNFYNII